MYEAAAILALGSSMIGYCCIHQLLEEVRAQKSLYYNLLTKLVDVAERSRNRA
jgi:hypothetical protein